MTLVERLRAAGCVFAEEEAAVLEGEAGSAAELEAMVRRRVGGEPLETVVGWAEFARRRIAVSAGVFVPRRRTELLVAEAVAVAPPGAVVVDLCCGTGAIGVAIAAAVPGAELHAADVEPAAVACARRNVEPVGGAVHAGDLFAALPARLRGRVDVLACNAPYVPSAEVAFMPPEARDHEPLVALDGGADGVDVHRRVAAGAAGWLAPAGVVLVETSVRQAPVTVEAFRANGLAARVVHDEELGGTVVIAQASAS